MRRQSHVLHCHRLIIDEIKRRTRSSSSSSNSNRSPINDSNSCVLVEENASSRTVALNRPSSLNALNAPMMKKLHKLYESWEHNPNVGFVVMKCVGNAFSAGGDLVSLFHYIKEGNIEGAKEILWWIYKFIYLVHTYSKPHVAILNGIVMGGGGGVSILGAFRIVTDKTMKKLHKLYESWEHNPNVGFVLMKGVGNAFSAGGDLVFLFHYIKEGNIEGAKEILWWIYKFIYLVHTYSKPHVAILNGIVMGGGGGVSILGAFRIVTDKTVFATPEALVGHHTDGGASFYLSRLPGHLGEYLGLTADRLNGTEMMACRLATHYLHHTNVGLTEDHLKNILVVEDPNYVIETFLEKYTDHSVHLDNNSVLKRMETVNKCFSHETVEEIINALETEAASTRDGWYFAVLKKLKDASPLSLKVILRSIREGRFQTLDQCLIREYQMTLQGITGKISSDFREGVRARMIDKDFAPKWDPPSLKHVSEDMVDQYFSPLSALEPKLDLPINKKSVKEDY
ncbi:hypothetical protein QVD17_27919 [Tagetes erecta]|uniref:3-hydroxyisobutyryl-CoA hydrolase n=1 Tax=Tagetes erecta TaxID=13708 RepID=A0AAD8NRT3_TARER|nr:hypothetical protein QVD17_27919 [Tagetes erecta]